MRARAIALVLCILAYNTAVEAAVSARRIAAQVSEENLRQTVSFLASLPSRVVGYDDKDGRSRSAVWVKARLHELGLQNLREEPFEVAVPIETRAHITVRESGRKLPLRSFWPNLVRTNQTPPGGITGDLIYCGKGDLRSFNGKQVEGSIVILDLDCGNAWFNALLLGARAIIFVESPTIFRGEAESKFLTTPVNAPRFFADRATGEELKAVAGKSQATVFSDMRWENRTAVNIVGEIPGSDPALKDEWIILEAYYDSISTIPSLAPGAETACGLAAMLETVRLLKQMQLKRSILVAATSGHFLGLAGVREFFAKRLPPGAKEEQKKDFAKFKAFVGFDLTSQSDVVGTFYKAHYIDHPEGQLQWKFGDIGKLLRDTAQRVTSQLNLPEECYVDGINPIKGKNWRTFLPAPMATDNEIANLVAKPGLAFVTANDARIWVNTPSDTVDRVNFSNVVQQVTLIACILPELINTTDKDLLDIKLDNAFYQVSGTLSEFDPKKSFIPDQPVGGSLAVMHVAWGGLKSFSGVHSSVVVKTPMKGKAKKGRFKIVGVPSTAVKPVQWRIEGFELAPDTGDIIKAPDRGSDGEEVYPANMNFDVPDKKVTLVMFNCKSMTIYDMVDQRRFALLRNIYIYDAQRDAQPFAYGYSLPEVPQLSAAYAPGACLYEPVAVVYAKPDTRIKVTMGADVLGLRFVLVNSTLKNYLGDGFRIDDHPTLPYTPYQVAKDMWSLDDFRARSLRRHGIKNDRVDKLHETAGELLEAATAALKQRKYDLFLSNVRAAWSYESRAYPDVQKTANDVVKGIIFYLALLLPFSFCTERLFFSFPDIRKQIAGASAIFLVIFALIRSVHPAFAITSTPWIILLAFIILALAAIVSSIITQKFEDEMRKMKLETGAIHAADVGRLSASAAAFNLGISNMRRRKARTTLTCITLVLLTFTVLSFTSVVTQVNIRQLRLKHKAPYNGIMIREQSWLPLGEPMARIVENELANEGVVAPRAWYLSALVGDQSFVTVSYGKSSRFANAVVGLTPQEVRVSKIGRTLRGRWFREGEMLSCVLPSEMAQDFGITASDIGKASIKVLGATLQVIGIVDSERLKNMKDLDGELFTPVDYSMMRKEQRESTSQTATPGELQEYIHMMPRNVVFVPYDFAILHGGDLRAVAVAFRDGETVRKKLQGLMQRIELNVYAGINGVTYLCSALSTTKPVGVLDLFVPIMIVALIVLNTMLGSVYERTNEIGIFGSLGLAPVHISALFIAEACVYAILGAIAGYVFGQVLSKVLVDLIQIKGLNLNYSSLSTVGSTIIIMLTVLLSTLYPAKKASEMSVPDVERRWKLPEPEGDYLRTGLPFTVSSNQSLGINIFLKQFFESHTDYSVGNFSTADVTLAPFETELGRGYRLEAMLWLAPYDLGVSEHLTLETVPTDDEWVNEVKITIRRESGDESSWLRVTRNFLNNLRKQFLIWRTCTPQVKEQYTRRGEEEMRARESEVASAI